jgi:Uma2 family endonuclease
LRPAHLLLLHESFADDVIHGRLDEGCRNRAEMKLRVGELKSRYPDIFVACEEPGDRRFFDDARVVVEVISPDYASKDLVEAPVEYARLVRLQQYIVIDSRKLGAISDRTMDASCSCQLRTSASRSRVRTSR